MPPVQIRAVERKILLFTMLAMLWQLHGKELSFNHAVLETIRTVPRGGRLHWLRTSLAAPGAKEALALHGRFWPNLLAGLENVLRHRNLNVHRTQRTVWTNRLNQSR